MGYTFFNLAYDVLKQANTPLSIQEIWENANKMGLVGKLSSSGKTPYKYIVSNTIDRCKT